MKCPECGKEETQPSWGYRGYCDECNKKKHTCEICGKEVYYVAVWQKYNKRGHYDCLVDGRKSYGGELNE